MLEYRIIESRIKTINVDFELLPEKQTSIDAKVNATMKIPGDININRVLFEITFEAEEKIQNQKFIFAIGDVIIEFKERPDYDKISQEDYPTIAMKDIVRKIDTIVSEMGFANLSFSNNEET